MDKQRWDERRDMGVRVVISEVRRKYECATYRGAPSTKKTVPAEYDGQTKSTEAVPARAMHTCMRWTVYHDGAVLELRKGAKART